MNVIYISLQPPEPPVCGNKIVETVAQEECDCGRTYEECDDPCCYPSVILQQASSAIYNNVKLLVREVGICDLRNGLKLDLNSPPKIKSCQKL